LLGGWFSAIGFKTMLRAVLIMVLGSLVLPCLLPLVMWSISTLIEAIARRKMATQLYLLQGYQRVKSPSLRKKKMMHFDKKKCQSIKAGNVGASLAIFLGFTVYLEFTLVSPL
jgi:hypothetical protein